MIHINLLPSELETNATPVNPAIPIVAPAVLILVIFLIPLWIKQKGTHKHLQIDSAALKSELERYQPIINQVEALEAQKLQLGNRKNIIQQLESERLRYPQFMDDFVKLLPGNLWLTNLTTVSQPGSNNLQVGMDLIALDNYAIADLISNLETSQIFSDIDMGTLNATQQAEGGQTISFHINTMYKRMNPVPDATKKS
ncbi:MAG: PilN domain-containing protein [Elusimicrobiota bacterium]|jgi:Tfp pilus assembly protein PilN